MPFLSSQFVKITITRTTYVSKPKVKILIVKMSVVCLYISPTNIVYIEIPTPYLKLDKSETGADPLAVRVTLGAISLIRAAERIPSLLTLQQADLPLSPICPAAAEKDAVHGYRR